VHDVFSGTLQLILLRVITAQTSQAIWTSE